MLALIVCVTGHGRQRLHYVVVSKDGMTVYGLERGLDRQGTTHIIVVVACTQVVLSQVVEQLRDVCLVHVRDGVLRVHVVQATAWKVRARVRLRVLVIRLPVAVLCRIDYRELIYGRFKYIRLTL